MSEAALNVHDRFFKQVFSEQAVAADFLRNYLPAEVVGLLDLSSLELAKDSFVDERLREKFSDLLYNVKLTDGEPAFVYVLFEHKSYADPLTSLQLLRYMAQIWDLGVRQKSQFVPIIPIVVYHEAHLAGRPRRCLARYGAAAGRAGDPVHRFAVPGNSATIPVAGHG